MKPLAPALALLAMLPLVPACTSTTSCAPPEGGWASTVRSGIELPIATAPYQDVRSNWKERLDQLYAYVELRGTYTHTARALKDVLEAVQRAGLEPDGAPFALFYDDPGNTPVADLRSRACVPIQSNGTLDAPYAVDVLQSATVVYAFVGGPYADVPRAYPAVFQYVEHMGWKECGPIREIYLVPPGSVASWNELVCEVQVPAAPAR